MMCNIMSGAESGVSLQELIRLFNVQTILELGLVVL